MSDIPCDREITNPRTPLMSFKQTLEAMNGEAWKPDLFEESYRRELLEKQK